MDAEVGAVGEEVESQGALFTGALNQDIDVGGECGLGVVLDISVSIFVILPISVCLVLPRGP